MAYVYYNPNPTGRNSMGDCSIRAVSKVLNMNWDEAFDVLVDNARLRADMPNSNANIDEVLSDYGFHKETFSDCNGCHTVKEFAETHPYGTYVLGTGDHVVAVINGNWFDSWRSDDESIIYYWAR